MKHLNAEKLDARLNPDRKVSRRKKPIVPRSAKVLDEPHRSAEEIEIEVGESEEWDAASVEEDKPQ